MTEFTFVWAAKKTSHITEKDRQLIDRDQGGKKMLYPSRWRVQKSGSTLKTEWLQNWYWNILALMISVVLGATGRGENSTTSEMTHGTITGSQLTDDKPALWRQIEIPGAQCGNGSPYRIYFRPGQKNKLSIGFMSGGACWNFFTCYGPARLTNLKLANSWGLNKGIFSQKSTSVGSYTQVFLPYCTGDVYIGQHTATYRKKRTRHVGKSNTQATLNYLAQNLDGWSELEKVFVHGSSAGAIGALLHLRALDQSFKHVPEKTLLADSPGMHFGGQFWNKFSSALRMDFKMAFEEIGLEFKSDQGIVAADMETLCHNYSDWNVGFIQFDQDFIMSGIFGNISPFRHKRNVYGEKGIWQTVLNGVNNCSAWVGQGWDHTVLYSDKQMEKTRDGLSVRNFIWKLLLGESGLTVPKPF